MCLCSFTSTVWIAVPLPATVRQETNPVAPARPGRVIAGPPGLRTVSQPSSDDPNASHGSEGSPDGAGGLNIPALKENPENQDNPNSRNIRPVSPPENLDDPDSRSHSPDTAENVKKRDSPDKTDTLLGRKRSEDNDKIYLGK